ncbi:MAG: type I-E CRISPR-associated protein Cas6/Cse3/CasE [Proteobacteria bacterium]|nr:type I-E CRISPR-associated protein Cas6/Cse3/CasE [Pseudomonadota bacterium]
MKLSRLFLNPMHREVRRCMADVQSLHTRISSGFDHGDRAFGDERVLFRPEFGEARCALLVQSPEPPDWTRLPAGFLLQLEGVENPETRELTKLWSALKEGQHLLFRLRANVTRKIETKTLPGEARRHGRRVPLRGDEARLQWLTRKGDQHGFQIPAMRNDVPAAVVKEVATIYGSRKRRRVTLEGTTFEGMLRVADVRKLRVALERGIGPAKAYGFGMLSVALA